MTKVLIVDSTPRDCERIATSLAKLDCVCSSCQSGADVFENVLPNGPPDIAIVLWELVGDFSGPEVVARLRRMHPALPIIVTLGDFDLSRVAKANAMGVREVLMKPIDQIRLRSVVARTLTGATESPLLRKFRGLMAGESEALLRTLRNLADAIPDPDSKKHCLLLVGENGTGKELLARAVHDLGNNPGELFVSVNVSAIPEHLIESILFGHETGTDVNVDRIGVFERCHHGTLFLEEIGNADAGLQTKLLRTIDERVFRRVGGSTDLKFEGRIICATNRDLEIAVAEGKFRPDLYHRIATHVIRIPPIRERGDDVWLLIDHFIKKHGDGRKLKLAREAKELLRRYPYYGNVRELENLIIHAIQKCRDNEIGAGELPVDMMLSRVEAMEQGATTNELHWPAELFDLQYKVAHGKVEAAFCKSYLPYVLNKAKHRIAAAARMANVDEKTFRKKWRDAELPPLSNEEKNTD